MPFRLFALNRWRVISFCNFPIGWPSSFRKPESKGYCVAPSLFLFEECPKGDLSEAVFITARNESWDNFCLCSWQYWKGSPTMEYKVSSPSFLLYFDKSTYKQTSGQQTSPLFLHCNSKTCQLLPSRDVPKHFLWGEGCFVNLAHYY